MSEGLREYKMWLVQQIAEQSFCSVSEAHTKATQWQDTPRFEASYARWLELNRDVILASAPTEQINFPNV